MNRSVFNIGYYIAVARPLAIPVLVATNLLFAYLGMKKETKKVVPITYFVGAGGEVQSVVCYPEAKLNENVARDLVEKLGQVLYAYSRGEYKEYAQKYKAFKAFLEPRSVAERKIRIVADRILGNVKEKTGPIFGQSSGFRIDRSRFAIKKSGNTWKIAATGIQEIESDKGRGDPLTIDIDITLVEGDENALYFLRDFSIPLQ